MPNYTLHETTFEYLKPTEDQLLTMIELRGLFSLFLEDLDPLLPAGPDKTYVLRQLRDCAMWANIAVTRNPDGSPRQ